MNRLLKPDDVMELLGISRKTALKIMWQCNPILIGGNVRKQIRITEDNLTKHLEMRMLKPEDLNSGKQAGTKRRIQRR